MIYNNLFHEDKKCLLGTVFIFTQKMEYVVSTTLEKKRIIEIQEIQKHEKKQNINQQ